MQSIKFFSLIRVRGPDARSFLHGQLSQDLHLLTADHALLASCNSAQGRVQAVIMLILSGEDILLLLPSALIDSLLARLRKYVMRARVTLEDGRPLFHLQLAAPDEYPHHSAAFDCVQEGDTMRVGLPGHWLVIEPGVATTTDTTALDNQLMLAMIRAGWPMVLPETSETFVAQMLNLDLLNGISFNKGCYTGQEIIARAHFRGAVKRRMFRLHGAVHPPTPGTRLLANGAHAGEVVFSAAVATGCELLAVLNLGTITVPLTLDDSSHTVLQLGTLPYAVPTAAAT